MPAWPEPGELPDAGLPAARFPVIGSFGNLTTTKRVPQLLSAFARVREEFPDALLLLVGRPTSGVALAPLLAAERLDDRHVLRLDYVDERRLWALMSASDVAVNLRWPTMGETSGTAIRSLVLGRPLVVSDVGWFGELPDDAVEKVPVGEREVENLATALLRLGRDDALRDQLGKAGQGYVRREHDLGRVVDAYVAAVEEGAGAELLRTAVLREVADAASDVGLGASGAELSRVSEALSEVGLGD
jgi:glycosyltransferase involved in cell wall biosynthesis